MNIIKRNGSEVEFDPSKIAMAIAKANVECDNIIDLDHLRLATAEVVEKCETLGHTPSVEEVQDMVEDELMTLGYGQVAKKYIKYRYEREIVRKANTTDKKILALLGRTNEEAKQENSNKNPTINSTQRDYMAGEVSKDITKRFLLPKDIWDAHEKGLIHFHDADYFAQPMYNCFRGDVRFLTKDGIRRFASFKDGDETTVMDKDGIWRKATVHNYGMRKMQKVFLKPKGNMFSVSVCCTPDHRWLLKDKTVTTELKVGDVLIASPQFNIEWEVSKVEQFPDNLETNAWCVEEPITHSFTLDGGIVTGNCCLINLEDMLENGTVISGTKIDKPHSFATACNIATQVIAAVGSNQYGGQSITLSHLAPFVDVSRQRLRKAVAKEMSDAGIYVSEAKANKIAEARLRKEVEAGIQTIQYQIITLMTTNGQAPFITVFMYLDEVPEGQTRDDLALMIEETLKQRIKGVKNEKGVYITPAFPKLIYCLDEDNIHEDSKYYYLTELAAQCTAKRMVPDYISSKIMKELKGEVYPCMGCVAGDSIIDYKIKDTRYVESFFEAWSRISKLHCPQFQQNGKDMYIDTPDVTIWDEYLQKYVRQHRIIRNTQSKWVHVVLSNGTSIDATADHPFEVIGKGTVRADLVQLGDRMLCKCGTCIVIAAKPYTESQLCYDVTTESEHFTVNGIYSHNCRSFLTPDRFTNKGIGNIAKAKNYKENQHKYYGRLTIS